LVIKLAEPEGGKEKGKKKERRQRVWEWGAHLAAAHVGAVSIDLQRSRCGLGIGELRRPNRQGAREARRSGAEVSAWNRDERRALAAQRKGEGVWQGSAWRLDASGTTVLSRVIRLGVAGRQ